MNKSSLQLVFVLIYAVDLLSSFRNSYIREKRLILSGSGGPNTGGLAGGLCKHCDDCICKAVHLKPYECADAIFDQNFIPRCSLNCHKNYSPCLNFSGLPPVHNYPKPTVLASTATTTTHKQIATTTSSMFAFKKCNKYRTLDLIGRHVYANDPNIGACADGGHHTPQAFVTEACLAPSPSNWHKRQHVMSNCSAIPAYSPIGTFYGNTSILAGVLLSCRTDGFQMVLQTCTLLPEIVLATHATKGFNVDEFYSISWR